jgi:penicillin amidase
MEEPKSGLLSNLFSALLRLFIRYLDEPAGPHYAGQLFIPRLRAQVKILWDGYGIPHVFAADERDLFVAQGYLHAQERLWQMELSRRFLSGRLAEIFGRFSVPWKELSSHFRGRDTVDFDYFMRLIGIRRAAVGSLELLSDGDRQRLQDYSDGVNSYIERCGKRLPWEFRLLRHEPDPWQPEDCLIVGKGFAFLLSTALFTRLNMIALAARLNGQTDKLRSLCPSYPPGGPTITRATWDAAKNVWQFMTGTFASSDWHSAGRGSNNWVIGAGRSATGNAILCNDPHLRLTLPSIWYLLHLKAESPRAGPGGYECWGASIPGAPCIQVGQNRWIAWGITAALCDDVELYREKTHPIEPNRYLNGHEWLTFETWDEKIRVRREMEVSRVVRLTKRGPIISDFGSPQRSSETLSFRWTAHDPSEDLRCVYGVNRARNWDEFLESLSYHVAPTLNYVFADAQGNIGYSLAGKIPVRAQVPSLLPLNGWDESSAWHGYLPFDELPRLYNPTQGFIATANNKIVDSSYPHYLSHFFEPPYRIRRIQELLRSKESFSIDDMAAMQSDVVSLHAKELIDTLTVDLLQIVANHPRLKNAAERLLKWDGKCHTQSIEATIFHVFHRRLMANLLMPALGEELFIAYVEIFNQCLTPIGRILRDPNSPCFVNQSRQSLVAKSLQEACEELGQTLGSDMEQWTWGRIHSVTLNHSLGRIKLLRMVLGVGPLPSPGDGVTINMGYYRYSNPYGHTVGASLRFISDARNWEQSRFILASGQSAHLSSPYYRDQIRLWRQHEYTRLFETEDVMRNWPVLLLTPQVE